jgi:hypothetical protein
MNLLVGGWPVVFGGAQQFGVGYQIAKRQNSSGEKLLG